MLVALPDATPLEIQIQSIVLVIDIVNSHDLRYPRKEDGASPQLVLLAVLLASS